jgi:hypothetical protein
VAVNCCVVPTAIVSGRGSTTRDVTGEVSVRNDQVTGTSALAAASLTAADSAAVYCVLSANGDVGVKVAVLPTTRTAPGTVTPAAVLMVKLDELSVEFRIGSENVTDTGEETGTSVRKVSGSNPITVGGVMSPATPPETGSVSGAKAQQPASALAATSRTDRRMSRPVM